MIDQIIIGGKASFDDFGGKRGKEGKKRLTEAGYDYAAIQKLVNKMLS